MVGVLAASRLPEPGLECLGFSGASAAASAPSPLRFLRLSRASCERGRLQGGWVRDTGCQIVGSVEGFLVHPCRRTVAAVVVRWNGRSPQCLCVVPLTTVVARVDRTDRTLNVEIPAGSSVPSSDAVVSEHYPAFSDDDLVAALFAGNARE